MFNYFTIYFDGFGLYLWTNGTVNYILFAVLAVQLSADRLQCGGIFVLCCVCRVFLMESAFDPLEPEKDGLVLQASSEAR